MGKFFLILFLALIGAGVYGYKNNPAVCQKLGTEVVADLTTIFTPGSGSVSAEPPAADTTAAPAVANDNVPATQPRHWKQGFVTAEDSSASAPAVEPESAPTQLSSAPAPAADTNRIYPNSDFSDYGDALKAARARNRPVLILFTGSDWCHYCQMLEQEVLSTGEFQQYKNSHVVFLTVDDLRNTLVLDDDKQRIATLEHQFHITGFPTMVVISSDEKELGRTSGYNPGSGPTAVMDELNKIVTQ